MGRALVPGAAKFPLRTTRAARSLSLERVVASGPAGVGDGTGSGTGSFPHGSSGGPSRCSSWCACPPPCSSARGQAAAAPHRVQVSSVHGPGARPGGRPVSHARPHRACRRPACPRSGRRSVRRRITRVLPARCLSAALPVRVPASGPRSRPPRPAGPWRGRRSQARGWAVSVPGAPWKQEADRCGPRSVTLHGTGASRPTRYLGLGRHHPQDHRPVPHPPPHFADGISVAHVHPTSTSPTRLVEREGGRQWSPVGTIR
jgi:hypothetical protein